MRVYVYMCIFRQLANQLYLAWQVNINSSI